jgi:hypothetical protein
MSRISAAGSRLPYQVSFGDTVIKVTLNKMLLPAPEILVSVKLSAHECMSN